MKTVRQLNQMASQSMNKTPKKKMNQRRRVIVTMKKMTITMKVRTMMNDEEDLVQLIQESLTQKNADELLNRISKLSFLITQRNN